MPRSSNAIPEPTTRSRTVRDTSTSPALQARSRARRCGLRSRRRPRRSPRTRRCGCLRGSRSPADGLLPLSPRPSESQRPGRRRWRGSRPRWIHLLAAEAPNLRPRHLPCRSSTPPARVTELGCGSVEPTMSVNSTVESTRSGVAACRAPVRNSSISSAISSGCRRARARVASLHFEHPRSRDPIGDEAATLHRHEVLVGVHDERWHADGRQYVNDVDHRAECMVARAIPGLAQTRSSVPSSCASPSRYQHREHLALSPTLSRSGPQKTAARRSSCASVGQ